MQEALASSQGTADPNHDLLGLAVESIPHHFSYFSANVLDCLRLSYKVKWPLNLLLTPDALEKYNLVGISTASYKNQFLLSGLFLINPYVPDIFICCAFETCSMAFARRLCCFKEHSTWVLQRTAQRLN